MSEPDANMVFKTEKELLPVLFHFCRSLFSDCHLPSHDHLHHLRVWQYAKELLNELQARGNGPGLKEIQELMLAVFFHDSGLTKTLEEDHGLESRKICEEFLENNRSLFTFFPVEALEAIEHHDKKEIHRSDKSDPERTLLKTLSVCDDIDAYGYIGVLRYAEIYLLRGIPLKILPGKVLKNISYRLDLLSSQTWIPGLFASRHKARFEIAYRFFFAMDQQQSAGSYMISKGILESYMEQVYYGKSDIKEFALELSHSDNKETCSYGLSLLTELHYYSLPCI